MVVPSNSQARPNSTREVHYPWPLLHPEDVRSYLWTAFGVVIPHRRSRHPDCANHVPPWTAFWDAYSAKDPVAVWWGSRGLAGKSFTLAALSLAEAIGLGADVSIVAGSGAQALAVHEYSAAHWSSESAPRELLIDDPTMHLTRLRNGAKIRALLASERQVRHGHPQRLRVDEADEMKLSLLDSALGQPQESASKPHARQQVVISSTWQHADGTMSEVMGRAQEKGWPIYQWCYRETLAPAPGWLLPSNVAAKRATMTTLGFRTEVELQEPSSEDRAIDALAVERMFKRSFPESPRVRYEFKGAPGEVIEPWLMLGSEQRFAHGADWAIKRDWTVIVTLRIDVRPWRVVSFVRLGRIPFTEMVKRFCERIKKFKGPARYDATGMDTTEGLLTEPAEGVVFTGAARTQVLNDYIVAVENGEIECPEIAWMHREHKCNREALWGHGHAPDSVVAMALAYRAAKSSVISAATPETVTIGRALYRPNWGA